MPSDYPLPKFHFQVEWGDEVRIGFTEVSGLDFETEVIEYREGTNKKYSKTKQPGLTKYSDITLKRGTFQGDNSFFNWWRQTYFFQESNSTGSRYRRSVVIKLLNEEHEPIVVWQLENAWPKKLISTDLNADANEIAIETLVVVHEGLTLIND